MGQNIDCGFARTQSNTMVIPTTTKCIPFAETPNKAAFNYINPVKFLQDFPEHFQSVNSMMEMQKKVEEEQFQWSQSVCRISIMESLEQTKEIKEIKVKWNSFIKMKQKNYLQDYQIVKNVIGKGGFGVVRKVKSKYTNEIRVAKIVRKKLMKQDDVTKLFTQLYIMKMLDHHNIVKLYEVYDFQNEFVLIIEMCTGGEVYSKTRKKKLPQKKAASIIKQVLRSLIYMHSLKVVHRDIKPQNMLFQNEDQTVVKLIDFGIAVKMQNDFLTDRIGTPSYISPQIIYKQYNQKCDIWATGVCFYQFITGKSPFSGEDDRQMMREIVRAQIQLTGGAWEKVSPQCKEVIKLMLTKNHEKRPSAMELFNHKYFAEIDQSNMSKSGSGKKQVINNFRAFKFNNKLQAVVQTFIASQLLTNEQKQALITVFRQIDVNSDGVISTEELREALRTKSSMTESRVDSMMKVIDINGSGSIEYTEFLVANYDSTIRMTKQRLKHVFLYFDTDKSGTITYSEVAAFLEDYQSSEEEIKRIFALVDTNGDGNISEEEFIELLVCQVSSNSDLKKISSKNISEVDLDCLKRSKRKGLQRQRTVQKEKARKLSFEGINELLNFNTNQKPVPVSRFVNT